MKKKWLIVSIVLTVMALGMIMTACSSGTETPGVEEYRYTVGNVLYILEMTENRGARYTAVNNDLYKLFAVYGGTGTPVLVSEGYIANVAAGATAKVQNYSLKDENGTNLIVQIVHATVTNASGVTSEVPIVAQVVGVIVPAPGSGGQTVQLAPGTPVTPNLPAGSTITNQPSTPTLTSPVNTAPSNTGNDNTNQGSTNQGSTNQGSANQGSANQGSANQGNNTANGSLTITNIPTQFNGKYIAVDAQKWILDHYLYLLGMQSINMTTGAITLVPISNGQASIPMWKAAFSTDGDLQSIARYSGSDTFTYGTANYSYLAAYIFPSATASYYTAPQNTTLDMKVFQSVTFTNGSGTINYATGFVPSEPPGSGEEPGTPGTPRPGTLITLPTGPTVSFDYSDWEEVTNGNTVTRNYLLENVTYAAAKTTLVGLLGAAASSGGALQAGTIGNVETASAWVVFEIIYSPGTTANTARFSYRLVQKVAGAYQENVNPEGVGWIATRDYSYGDDSSTSLTFSRGTGMRADEADVTKKEGATLTGTLTIPDLYYTGAEYLPVTLIKSEAFRNCVDITSVNFPYALKIISESAFNTCGLTSLPFPDSLTTIGGNAFHGNPLNGLITITKNVTSIGSSAFGNCPSLSKIQVEAGNTSFSSDGYWVLYNNDKTTLVKFPEGSPETTYDIPSGVTTIGSYAVYSVDELTAITIPDSVTTIEGGAFQSCGGLTSIIIPADVTSIGTGAFAMSYNLTEIFCKPATPPTLPAFNPNGGDKVFPPAATIKVPADSLATYRTAENWSDHVADVDTKIIAEE